MLALLSYVCDALILIGYGIASHVDTARSWRRYHWINATTGPVLCVYGITLGAYPLALLSGAFALFAAWGLRPGTVEHEHNDERSTA